MTQRDTLFFKALDVASPPLFVLDKSGRVILWNRACEEFTGVLAADILQSDRHWQVFYPEATQKRPTLADVVLSGRKSDFTALYEGHMKPRVYGNTLQAEGWYPNLGGKVRYIIFNAAPVYDGKGEIEAVIETFQDVTERVQAESQLKRGQAELIKNHSELSTLLDQVSRAKEQWEKTMDCIDDLVFLIDPEGRVRRCNRTVTALVGRPYNEILGMPWRELILTDDMEANFISEKEAEMYHRPSGRWFYLKKYVFRGSVEGENTGAVVTLHDLTEIKKVSSQLEDAYSELKATQARILQTEKMASIGQLAAGVAHEINNPIGFVSSNLGTLGKYVGRLSAFIHKQSEIIRTLGDASAEKELAGLQKELKLDFILEDVKQLLAESLDGTERVRKIVQDLKSFSRVDDSDRREVDLNECMESTLNIVWNELKYTTTIEKDYGDLPLVSCFPQQINQVFMNLLVNAGQAIEGKGTIGIRSWQEGAKVCISISDTGCGIPAQNIGKLFEPFFTTKEVGKGTGLGLSISYDIIKKHGGEILVESTLGEGTTFVVVLPCPTA